MPRASPKSFAPPRSPICNKAGLSLQKPRVLEARSILIVILLLILIDKGFAPSGAACDERGDYDYDYD
jgi:hypothetical protein